MIYITPSDVAFIIGKIYICIALVALIDQTIRHVKSRYHDT
jgi:hypothetical protein